MSALKIFITDAGRAELINADHSGTAQVLIAQIGLGTGQYSPAPTQASLVAEFKRLDTIAGTPVSNDTIHLTIRDDSDDAYEVAEFGLYTASGTLFAVYSQGDGPFIQKAPQSSLLLSVDIVLGTLNANGITFGDTSFANPPASTTVAGIVRLATLEETSVGEDEQKAITPAVFRLAANALIEAAIDELIASSPAALDTLNELAQALGNDPNFATTVAEAIALKAPLNSPALTGAPTAPTASIGSSDQRIANTEFVQSAIAATLGSGGIVPTGSVIHVTANSAPTGYLKVNGATLSRTAYAGLWAYAQGSGNLAASEAGKPRGQFGPGDGATTFTIPDARGDFIRSWSDGSTIDSGRTLGSFQDHALQTHDHRIDVNRNLAYAGGGGRANDAPDVNDAYSGNGGIDRTSAPVTGNTAAETRPRNIAWLACIKY